MKKSIKKFEQFTIKNSNNIKGGTTNGGPKHWYELGKGHGTKG